MDRFFNSKSTVKGFLKFTGAFLGIYMGLLCVHFYVSKDDPYVLGVKLSAPEEFAHRVEALETAKKTRRSQASMSLNIDRIFPVKPNTPSESVDKMKFYDGIEYRSGFTGEVDTTALDNDQPTAK